MPFRFDRLFWIVTLLLMLLPQTAPGAAVQGPEATAPADDAKAQEKVTKDDEVTRAAVLDESRQSDAERVARLQRSIEVDETELARLRSADEDPNSEFHRAEAEFMQLDEQWIALKERLTHLRDEGSSNEATAVELEIETVREHRELAQERFELAIQERKARREKANMLAKKIQQDRAALGRLLNEGIDEAEHRKEESTHDAEAAENEESEDHSHSGIAKADSTGTSPIETLGAEHAARISEELAEAEELAREKAQEARQAMREAQSVAERLESLHKSIAIEQQLLSIARTKSDQAHSQRAQLAKELQRRLAEDPVKAAEVLEGIAEADQRIEESRGASRASQLRLEDLRTELNELQEERVAALAQAKRVQEEAAQAKGAVERLKNPFRPQNMLQWALDHGPKLMTILIGMLLLHTFGRLSSRQLARTVARSASRGTADERENRAATLVGVFRNLTALVVLGGGTLMMLDESGIPIMPLMGGAAVFGLAVAFGAQNLIKDYFCGFMVLMEDQYGINDRVRIGQVSGVVEKITLRLTVVRDIEGTLHFMPHGSISMVSNMSYSWSRAVVEISVSQQEDPDYVMKVLMEVANDLRDDPIYAPIILDRPEMMGLENVSDSAMTIKFSLKTHPLQRGPVRRELLRRIKLRFDELRISLPVQRRAIYSVVEGDSSAGSGNRKRHTGDRAA